MFTCRKEAWTGWWRKWGSYRKMVLINFWYDLNYPPCTVQSCFCFMNPQYIGLQYCPKLVMLFCVSRLWSEYLWHQYVYSYYCYMYSCRLLAILTWLFLSILWTANKDAHHSVSERTTMNPSYYVRMVLSHFYFPAVVETSPMMPADYREEVSHQLGGVGGRQMGSFLLPT